MKIVIPFLGTNNRDPKKDPNFDNHPYVSWHRSWGCWGGGGGGGSKIEGLKPWFADS